MKNRISAAIGTGFMLWSLSATAVVIGEPAPAFNPLGVEHSSTTLPDFSGKVVLVNFWASWCGPCREEIPELMKIRTALADQGFEVVGINIDKERAKATEFMQRLAIDFPVIFDAKQEVINSYKAKSMPTSFLIDRDGTVRNIFYGYTAKKRPSMETAITELVRATPAPQTNR